MYGAHPYFLRLVECSWNISSSRRKSACVRLVIGLWVSLWFGLFQAPVVQADISADGNLVVLTDGQRQYNLNQSLRYWIDDGEEVSKIADLLKTDIWSRSRMNPSGPLNLGYQKHPVWIIVPLLYQGRKDVSEWWLNLDLPLLENSSLYVINDKGRILEKKSLNYHTPLKKRDFAYPRHIYKVNLQRDETRYLFLRVQNNFSIHLPLSILSSEGLVDQIASQDLFFGLFTGAVLIMFSYNLFVFLSVKEKSYFYYIIYIFSYLVFLITERNYSYVLLGKSLAIFDKNMLAHYIWLSWFFALAMARAFLETKKRDPDLDQILILFIRAAVISLFISLFADVVTTIRWSVFCTLFYAIMVMGVAFTAMRRGNRAARAYFLAWLFNFVGVAIYALTIVDVLPFNLVTANSAQLGILLQLVLISFALADRIKTAQKDTLSANQRAVDHLKRYRELYDNAVEGIFQMSLDRRFLDANPAMVKMLGCHNKRELRHKIKDGLSACYSNDQDLRRIIAHIQQGHDIRDFEGRYLGPANQERWARSSLSIVYDDQGEASHIEGRYLDITERVEKKRVERQRKQDLLEKEMAKNSAAAKSQFLANMSHEIRTPLTAIIGYGEMLLEDDLPKEERQESAGIVVKSGRHLLSLINDILDHSKIDANKLDIEILDVHLNSLMDEVRLYFESRARNKGLDFKIEYVFPLPGRIYTDATRFKQILINLCGNAMKFTEHGGITLFVSADKSRSQLQVKVADTGIGLKPEQMQSLFDPFAQASPSIARQYGGTGLGLSISKRLANLLGGDIVVESVEGEGTEFTVTISIGEVDDIHWREAFASEQKTVNLVDVPKLKGRILYAEDNEINQRLVSQLIRNTGLEIDIVDNGAEALEQIKKQSYDLVLMDIQMPVLNGQDATMALRRQGVETPIIALTANVMSEDISEYRQAGCDETLAKPIVKQQLYNTLAYYLPSSQHVGDNENEQKLQGSVLLAEDDPDSAALMKTYLSRMGLEVFHATNGKKAVEMALSKTVHAVILDQNMPEMDGPDACKLLRQAGFARPILAFSADDLAQVKATMVAAGCDDIIHKPVKRMQMYRVLRRFLKLADESPDGKNNQTSGEFDEELVPLIESFLEGVPQRRQEMEQAIEEWNWEKMLQLFHQLKGTAGSLGFPELTDLAKQIESSARQRDSDAVKSGFHALQEAMSAAMNKYQMWNNARSASSTDNAE